MTADDYCWLISTCAGFIFVAVVVWLIPHPTSQSVKKDSLFDLCDDEFRRK